MKRIAAALLAVFVVVSLSGAEKIKVACVGDSVTYGYGLEDRDHTSYPAKLQQMLGDAYEVGNFGHSGATLLNKGHRPYTTLPEYKEALDFKADLVVIHLGLNDTDPRNWPNYAEEFIQDYRGIIDAFKEVNPAAKIWICRMSPIFHGHHRFLSGTRDWYWQEQAVIEQIAATAGVDGLIDLQEPLYKRPDLFKDNIHPNAEGAEILAKTVYGAISGNYGGLKTPATYSDHMVLQRDKALKISGTDDSGSDISVALYTQDEYKAYAASKKRKKQLPAAVATGSAASGGNGKWTAELPSQPAGGPYVLRISDQKSELVYSDVWMGEVWLCSGQSNMEFMVKQCTSAKEDMAAADPAGKLHLYNMQARWRTDNVEWPEDALEALNRLDHYVPTAWTKADPESVSGFSAIAYHFGKVLADSLGCHVGLICNAVGGSTTESWIDRKTLEWNFPQVLYNWNDGDFGQEWARGRAKKNCAKAADLRFQRHPYQPVYLFESGILPLEKYGIKGIVWYQGESNAHNIEVHEDLFTLLVKSWRTYWGEQLPVHMVQLSGIERPSWSKFRDSQRRLAETIDGVYMTVCSDLGNPTDVHPRNKRPVGQRVAASALHNDYGFKAIVPSGPAFRCAKVEDGKVVLSFDYAEGMKTSDGAPLRMFEIAGPDGIYYDAVAKIGPSGTITVSSSEVKTPVSVRYAWRPYPAEANLVGANGMPCSTFLWK